jgi:pilus assembly protein CpaB
VSARSGLVLLLSLTFGGSAALGVNRYVASKSLAALPHVDNISVVVASTSIPRGATITAELVKTRDYPRSMVPDGALATLADALERTVFIPLVKDEPILDSKLAPKGAKRGMAALIPDGLRAFTIHTPSVASGVGGFILPGNKVDVLLTLEGKQGSITTTLLQNLEILAVDQRIDAPADNRVDPNQLRSVTLLVTPGQAARLSLGQSKGALHLSLRNHKDEKIADTAPARYSELDGRDREPPPATVVVAPPAPAARVVTIYRGVRSVEQFKLGEGDSDAFWAKDEPR